jgi:ribonuclease P protein component
MGVKRSIPSSEGFDEAFSNPDTKVSTKHFLLLLKENDLGYARIGVAVRKKDIKLAVQRNKIRRKIKGSFNVNTSKLTASDHVVLVKKNITSDSAVIKKELEELWQKLEKLR